MMVLRHCPHCGQRTAQLLQWHRLVPHDYTRHCCQSCQAQWDEYDPTTTFENGRSRPLISCPDRRIYGYPLVVGGEARPLLAASIVNRA